MSNRVFKAVVVGLAGLLIVSIAVGAALLGTEPGTRWLLRTLAERAPGELVIGRVEGALLEGVRLDDLRFADAGTVVTIGHLALQWRPRALLERTVAVTRLRVSGVDVQLPAPEEAPSAEGSDPLPLRLPFHIELADAEITDVQVRHGERELPVIARLAASARLRGTRLQVETLEIEGPQVHFALGGEARLTERLPIDLALRWTLIEGERRWSGAGTVSGDRERLRLEQGLSAPLAALLYADVERPLDDPRWRGTMRIQEAALETLDPALPPAVVAVTLEGEGSLGDGRASVQASIDSEQTGPLGLAAEVAYDGELITLASLVLRQTKGPGVLRLGGTLALSEPTPTLDLHGDWDALGWPLRGAAQVVSERGGYRLHGSLERYRFDLQAHLSGEQVAPGQWQLSGHGDGEGLMLTALRGELLEGTVAGSGALRWDPVPGWEAQLQWQGIDPAWYAADWSGALHGRAQVRGALPDTGPELSVELDDAGGTLRGRIFAAEARARLEGAEVAIEEARLRSGRVHLQAEGHYGARLDLSWRVAAEALEDLLPDAEGRLHARGRIQGTRQAPILTARADARGLRWGEYGVGALDADIVVPAAGEALGVTLEAAELVLGERRIEEVRLEADGPLAGHGVGLEVRAPEGALRLSAHGGWDGATWAGELNALQLEAPQVGIWAAPAPAPLRVEAGHAELQRLCLAQGAARLCTRAQWQAGQALTARLELAQLPLGLFAFALPEDLTLTGDLNGSAELALAGETLQAARADIRLGPGQVALVTEQTGPLRWDFGGGGLQVRQTDGALVGRMGLDLGEGQAGGEVRMGLDADLAWPQRPLAGSLQVRLDDLELVEIFVPQLAGLEGSAEVRAALAGTVAAPRVRPAARLVARRAEVPPLGLVLEDLDLRLDESAPERIDVQGRVRSGPGTLQAEGVIALSERGGWAVDLAASGTDFQVVDTAESQALASPDLQIAVRPGEAQITGTIRIPEAHLAPRQAASVVRPSSDVVVVGGDREPEAAEPRWRTRAQVRLELGDAVHFAGFGFTGRIGGALSLVEEPERITIATGTLEIHDASYRAYGQELQVEQGRLIYSESPVINPGLDFTAARQVEDVRVGVRVTGTALDPRLSLFSVPPMSETDVLAYLVVGRPLDRVSGAEGEALMTVATSAGLAGGGLLASRIGERLGFEDVSVERETGTDEAWLTVGRYLSPKLYMSYGLGLFESGNIVTLRYQLTDRLRVQGQSGEASGADIIWTFER